jgi:hypothetical protein
MKLDVRTVLGHDAHCLCRRADLVISQIRGAGRPALARMSTLCVLLACSLLGPRAEAGRRPGQVTNGSGPLLDSSRVLLAEELRLVGRDSATPFSYLLDLIILGGTGFAVLDEGDKSVNIFDHRGRFLRAVGRPGRGPGELGRYVLEMFAKAPDTFLVPDRAGQRINVYTVNGSSLAALPGPRTEVVLAYMHGPRGELRDVIWPWRGAGRQSELDSLLLVRRITATRVDTIHTIYPGGTFASGKSPLLAAIPVVTGTPSGGMLIGYGDKYVIVELDSSFRVVRTISRKHVPEPVTALDLDAIIQAMNGTADAATTTSTKEKLMKGFGVASHYPAYVAIRVDDAGRIWVQRPLTGADMQAGEGSGYRPSSPGGRRWDVFTKEGRYLAEVVFPRGFRMKQFWKGDAYGFLVDADGSMTVRRISVRFQPAAR